MLHTVPRSGSLETDNNQLNSALFVNPAISENRNICSSKRLTPVTIPSVLPLGVAYRLINAF